MSKCKRFFRPVAGRFAYGGYGHFWRLVLALTISHAGTIERLTGLLRGPAATHRTNHGEFLWRSDWNEAWVLRDIALDTLRRLDRLPGAGGKDKRVYLILDDTQTLKRAKKMQGVGKLYHHATGTWGRGHTILKACLHMHGVTIPWASVLYVKKEHAKQLGVPFRKLTELAAQIIRDAELPVSWRVTVLFDAYYLCPTVAGACHAKGWHYVGVGKSNRCFTPAPGKGDGAVTKLGKYGQNVLRREGRWRTLEGLASTHRYRIAQRRGHLRGLGEVNIVFSRRRGERKTIALVTDDLRAPAAHVVQDYLKRWAVELLIKDEKQHLGLGDYRVLRYRAVVRHLHLVDVAHACLTHLALEEHQGAQGEKTTKTKPLRLPPISQLKSRMRQVLWREAVEDVVKASHERPVIRRLERLMAA